MSHGVEPKMQDLILYLVLYTFSIRSKLLFSGLDFKHAFFLISSGKYTSQGFANCSFEV
jgi:hypothetical protein